MKNAAYQMLKAAIANGWTVIIHDGNESDYRGMNLRKAWSHATACDSIEVTLMKAGERNQWASLVTAPLVDPDETLADFTGSGWINDWYERTDGGQTD